MTRTTLTRKSNGRYYLGMSQIAAAELIAMVRRSNLRTVATSTKPTDMQALVARASVAGALDTLERLLSKNCAPPSTPAK